MGDGNHRHHHPCDFVYQATTNVFLSIKLYAKPTQATSLMWRSYENASLSLQM